jgi:hypothetical protein
MARVIAAVSRLDVFGWAMLGVGVLGIAIVIYAWFEELRAKRHLSRMRQEADAKRQPHEPDLRA